MPAKAKIEAVAALKEKFSSAQAMILADYRGLSVIEISALRSACREQGVEVHVVKNRLAKRALNDAGLPALDEFFTGPTAVAISTSDPVAPAKAMSEFAKSNDKLQIKGGLFEGRPAGLNVVKQLASLPSREELLSRLAGSLASPSRNFACALAAITAGFARALRAVADQKEAA